MCKATAISVKMDKDEGKLRIGIIASKVEEGDTWVDVLWNNSTEPSVEAVWNLEVINESRRFGKMVKQDKP
jgi:hypothetical protein